MVGDVVMYDGLVSVIQELELMLRSHDRIFNGSHSTSSSCSCSCSCSCSKQDIQIVYDAVTSMASLLIDSDYNYDYLIIENDMIISAVHDAQDFLHSCIHGCCCSDHPNTQENQTAANVPGRTIDDLKLLHSIIKYLDSIHKSGTPTPTGKASAVHGLMRGQTHFRNGSRDFSRLMHDLSNGSRLNILAFVGKKGIGKCTSSFISYDTNIEFDINECFNIGPLAEVGDVLRDLLYRAPYFSHHESINDDCGNVELVQQIYKCLRGRKYLIVLEDICDYKIWDGLKRAFPDDKNGSRIILTTQQHCIIETMRWSILMGQNLTTDAGDGASTSTVGSTTKELINNIGKLVHYKSHQNLKDDFTFGDDKFEWLNLTYRDNNVEQHLVGRHEQDMDAMIDILTAQPLKLKVFAVTGTGGIGKTTYIAWLYDDPYVHFHFDIRAWFTISQHYQVREVLIGLLRCVTNAMLTGIDKRSNEELREKLYQSLLSKRYLIVLDDMWDKNVWDDLKRAFPDDKNGSRIMLTTRFRDVAIHASPDTPPHCLYFLNLDESWELLYSKIFEWELCPRELVSIGKSIAFLCRGLPLAIILIGSYLSKMNKTAEIWNEVVSLMARGVILDDVEQELGCCHASYIETVITGEAARNDLKKAVSSRLREAIQNVVKRVVGFLQGSNIETQTNIMDSAVGTVNSRCLRIQEKIDSIKKELKKICNDKEVLQKAPQSLVNATPAGYPFTVLKSTYRTPNDEDKLVGHEKDLLTMLDHLTRHSSKLKVFAVTGMGGIGKTTFTNRLYDNPFVIYHFHCRAWFTISQQYREKEMLIGLLHCLTDVTNINEQSIETLREQLYKSLKGKKYLIVLDDMWDNNAWNDLKIILPDDGTGSRILLTSRLEDVAVHASPDTPPHCLSFLSEDESWELLQSKIFAKESCPLELEAIGKQIAGECKGLPLAVVLVGGLLSNMNKTLKVWQQFAQSVSSRVMEKAENCKNILALSYNHLPHHLKVCFLYMGIFPEDYVIPVHTVMWLWIAEGFIRPMNEKSFEELAEEYLEDLISRNLIMMKRREHVGRSNLCYIHDLLRDFCLNESQNQNFFHAFRSVKRQDIPWEMQRRLCFQSKIPDHVISSSFPYIRSFLWFKTLTSSNDERFLSMNFKLLKVMDIRNLHLKELPRKILGLAHLRYLSITIKDSIDRSIFSSKLHNLQILIIESDWNGRLPKEFWEMSEIRHVQIKRCFLSYWPDESRPNILQLFSASESLQPFICQLQIAEHWLKDLHNLQSLTTIRPISCTKNVFLSMPNLKKLGICETEEDNLFRGWFKNLIHLQELQTLKYILRNRHIMKPDPLPSPEFFPPKLTKLTLRGTSFPWEDMIKLSELPNLEVLKLKNNAFSGATWKSEDGGFPRLKYLLIHKTNLQSWEASGSPFPSLQHLVMMYCSSLEEIPCSIGEAPLLEKIELHYCSDSAATSALQIQTDQQDFGNDGLTVYISKW